MCFLEFSLGLLTVAVNKMSRIHVSISVLITTFNLLPSLSLISRPWCQLLQSTCGSRSKAEAKQVNSVNIVIPIYITRKRLSCFLSSTLFSFVHLFCPFFSPSPCSLLLCGLNLHPYTVDRHSSTRNVTQSPAF